MFVGRRCAGGLFPMAGRPAGLHPVGCARPTQRLIQMVRRTAGRSRKCGEVDDPAVTAAETPTSATGGQQRYSEVGGN
jgi:hypothetical protein